MSEFLAAFGWQLLLMGALLVASGLFSGTETAIFSLSRAQLQRLSRRGAVGRLVVSLLRRPGSVLNTLLLGNMLVNVAYASVAAVGLLDLGRYGLAPWAVALAALAPLAALVLLGEVSPKMLALVAGERWALAMATPLALLERACRPVLWGLEHLLVGPLTRLVAPRPSEPSTITSEELAAVLDLSARRGVIDRDVGSLLQEIVELTCLKVGDVMVPRVDVVAHDVDAPGEELLELFRRTHLRKIPVYEGDVDHTLGVVHAKRLGLHPDAPLREMVVPVPFVPVAANLERVLLQFRVTRTQMAIVVDEYGGTAGLVTLHDILEEIVGELPDPGEPRRGAAVRRVGRRAYVLDGNLAIHEWQDAFKVDLAGGRISTVGGFVVSLLGRIPRAGDAVSYRNLRFRVESMRGRRIGKLRLDLEADE